MTLHFEGDKDFRKTPAELWPKLTDAGFLVQCVPGVESVSQSEAAKATCVLRPGFAFVRGSLDLTVEVLDTVPDTAARMLLTTKGIGSSSVVEASFNLTAEGPTTKMHWTAEIKNLGGLLRAVPQGLIKAAAQKVIADALSAIDTKLSA
jgi:carbon monoxide dehydrogenase subunit G